MGSIAPSIEAYNTHSCKCMIENDRGDLQGEKIMLFRTRWMALTPSTKSISCVELLCCVFILSLMFSDVGVRWFIANKNHRHYHWKQASSYQQMCFMCQNAFKLKSLVWMDGARERGREREAWQMNVIYCLFLFTLSFQLFFIV